MGFDFKKIFLFFFIMTNANASILYEKNNIFITKYDIELYSSFMNLDQNEISEKKIIKEIFLIKKTINKLINTNLNYIKSLDQILIKKENTIKNDFYLDLLRYTYIRNEFIRNYFSNELMLEDINTIISQNSDFIVPISLNNCITIESLKKINEIKNFDKIYLELFKYDNKKSIIEINSKEYEICFDKKIRSELEKLLTDYILLKTENDFKKFLYEK